MPHAAIVDTFSVLYFCGDYEHCIGENPAVIEIQVDLVIGKISYRKAILTIMLVQEHFQIGHMYVSKGATAAQAKEHLKKVLELSQKRTNRPVAILADNGIEPDQIHESEDESSKIKVFFTRPYCSSDKAECERNREFLRYTVPKSISLNNHDQTFCGERPSHINSYAR